LVAGVTDFAGAWQGVLLGMSNTAGVLAGVLGTAATGFILQNGRLEILILHSSSLFPCKVTDPICATM